MWTSMCVLPGHCPCAHRHHETAADNHPSPPPIRRWHPNALLLPSNHPCTLNRSRLPVSVQALRKPASRTSQSVRDLLSGASCCDSNQPQPGSSGSEEQEGGASQQVSRYSPLTPPALTLPQLMESGTGQVELSGQTGEAEVKNGWSCLNIWQGRDLTCFSPPSSFHLTPVESQ